MKKNIGKADMIIRIIIGIVIASIGIVYKSWWGLVAIIPIATALVNFCPLYTLFGCSSCSTKEQKE